jgi:hypothetical protein
MAKKNTPKGVMLIPDSIEFAEPGNANSLYELAFDKQLIAHLSKGLSFGSFDVGVTTKTLHQWLKKHPTFYLARERGEKKRLQLLEAAGIKMIIEGNAVAWKFMMQDYGMTEKLEISMGRAAEDDAAIEAEMQNITPERSKRLERIRDLGRKLKIE